MRLVFRILNRQLDKCSELRKYLVRWWNNSELYYVDNNVVGISVGEISTDQIELRLYILYDGLDIEGLLPLFPQFMTECIDNLNSKKSVELFVFDNLNEGDLCELKNFMELLFEVLMF